MLAKLKTLHCKISCLKKHNQEQDKTQATPTRTNTLIKHQVTNEKRNLSGIEVQRRESRTNQTKTKHHLGMGGNAKEER